MSFYEGLKETASKLLQDKGQEVTFTRKPSNAFDPALGKTHTSTTTFTGYGASFDYKSSQVDGTLIIAGDIRLTLEAITTAPVIGDDVEVDGVSYSVINVTKTSPAGIVVKYEIQLRK